VTRFGEFSPNGRSFILGRFIKVIEVAQHFFRSVDYVHINFDKNVLGYILRNFLQTHLVALLTTWGIIVGNRRGPIRESLPRFFHPKKMFSDINLSNRPWWQSGAIVIASELLLRIPEKVNYVRPRVDRWYICKPKIPILVYFGRHSDGNFIRFMTFCMAVLDDFIAIWYICGNLVHILW
jgi:hypothetical protein